MPKDNSKKLKDVCAGDVLYMLRKNSIEEGIIESTVTNVITNPSGSAIFETETDRLKFYPLSSDMRSASFRLYDGSVVATSREVLLKASEKLIKKLLDRTDADIAKLKSRLDYQIENRNKIYALYLDSIIPT